jgi:hypothetical protein
VNELEGEDRSPCRAICKRACVRLERRHLPLRCGERSTEAGSRGGQAAVDCIPELIEVLKAEAKQLLARIARAEKIAECVE